MIGKDEFVAWRVAKSLADEADFLQDWNKPGKHKQVGME
jgi:hypothetical protein